MRRSGWALAKAASVSARQLWSLVRAAGASSYGRRGIVLLTGQPRERRFVGGQHRTAVAEDALGLGLAVLAAVVGHGEQEVPERVERRGLDGALAGLGRDGGALAGHYAQAALRRHRRHLHGEAGLAGPALTAHEHPPASPRAWSLALVLALVLIL